MGLGRPHRPNSGSGMAGAREARKEENHRDEQGTAIEGRRLQEYHNYESRTAAGRLQTWIRDARPPQLQSR